MAQPTDTLLSFLEDAKQNGFIDDFFLNEEYQFICNSQHVPNPLIIEMIPCMTCGATLYLVAGGNRRGTWVHQHDS